MAEKREKKNADCQTMLQCRPHFLCEDEVATVRIDADCQTEVVSLPDQTDSELFRMLRYVDPEAIESNAVRQLAVPRKTRLQFRLPEVMPSTGEVDESLHFEERLSDSEQFGRNSRGSEMSNRGSESDHMELYSILKRPSQCRKSRRPKEQGCQTNLMVAPHFLENDEHAFVTSTQFTQTSVTCLPDDSMSNILPKLETRLIHQGMKQIPCDKQDMLPGSVLDFIKNLLNKVESKQASLQSFQDAFILNTNAFQNKSESEPTILRNSLDYEDVVYVEDVNSFHDLKQVEDDENCACLVQFVDTPKKKSVRITESRVTEKESCYPLDSTKNSLCLKGSHDTVKCIVNEIIDRSESAIPTRCTTSVQDLLSELLNSVTSMTDLKKIPPKPSLATGGACKCKVPHISINILMNQTSQTNINIHATASIRFGNDNFMETQKCLTNKPSTSPSIKHNIDNKKSKCCTQDITVNVTNNNVEETSSELQPVVKQSCMSNKKEVVSCMEKPSQKVSACQETQPEKNEPEKTAPEYNPETDIIKLCVCKRDPEKKSDSLALCFCKKDGKNEPKSKSMCACQENECNTIVASNVDTKGLDIFGNEPPERDTDDSNTEQEPIRICACKNKEFNSSEPFQKCDCKKGETNTCCGTKNADDEMKNKTLDDVEAFETVQKTVTFLDDYPVESYQKPVGSCTEPPRRSQDVPSKILEQNIIMEESLIVAAKLSKMTTKTSTISDSEYLCITSSKVIEQTTSVFGSEEDKGSSECTSPKKVAPEEERCRRSTFTGKNSISKSMSCPRNNTGTFKCAPGSSKPVKNVTIGIGPVKPDENRKGCLAIPVRVVLNRRSESDTVVHAVSDRHYSFHCDDNSCVSRKPEEAPLLSRESSLLAITTIESEVVESPKPLSSLKYCGVTRCEENIALTELDVEQEYLSDRVTEDKCTMETCAHWSKSKKEPSFGIPWEHVLIQGEVEMEPVTEESSMEILPIEFPDEVIEDDSDVEVGCCGASKPKEKPKPIPPIRVEPVAAPEPKPEKIDLIYSHHPCPVIEPYICALLQGDNEGSVGVCLEDTIMPQDVKIREGAIVESVESLPQQQSVAPTLPACNVVPSRPAPPERIHKRINLRESLRFAEHKKLVESRSTRPIITIAGRPITSGPGSIYTLFRSNSCLFPSTTIPPIEEKYSTFIAAVDFNEETFPLKSTMSKFKRPNITKTTHFAQQDTTLIFQNDREIDFETTSTEEIEIVKATESLTVAQVVRSVASSEVPKCQAALQSGKSSSDEVVFSNTLYITESLDLLMPDKQEQVCGPCNLKMLPDTSEEEASKDKEDVCPPCDATVPAKQESTCCLIRKPNTRRNVSDVCEPCKMVVQKDSDSSMVAKRDPVTLALMACEKELKPVRQALNKVRVKLRNMNMPELDYLFKNETDIKSYPRIEPPPIYSTGYTSASYNYPSSSYSRTSYDPLMSNYDACNCCYCSYGSDYNNQPREPYSAYTSRASMRTNDVPNCYSATQKKSKVMFHFGNIPYKTEPSVSIMHENRRIFNYAESQENCNINFDSDKEDTSSCSSRTKRKKKNSGRSKSAKSSGNSCNNCPFFEALKAVLSVDNANCKKKAKTVRVTSAKSKAVYTTDKIRLRLKLKPA